MFNKNSNFTISLLSKIIGESIEYFISCINIIIELCIFLKINNMYKTEINPSNS